MVTLLQQLINGLTLGAVYGLIAIGYTMVYGIIGMINFAHGDIYMIGAFQSLIVILVLGFFGITWVPLALVFVLLIAVSLTALYGWAVERVAYRPLRGSTRLAPLISAIGMSIFLSNLVQVTQGPRNKPVPSILSDVIMLSSGANGCTSIWLMPPSQCNSLSQARLKSPGASSISVQVCIPEVMLIIWIRLLKKAVQVILILNCMF
jgi:branched-chain amino acid transport system permease protein